MRTDALLVIDIHSARFDELEIDYYVGGSVASSVYGIFRSTNDADIVVDIKDYQISDLVEALSEEFYIDADMIRDALLHGLSFNVIHLSTMIKADLFPMKRSGFALSEMQRRRKELIRATEPPRAVYFASPEDMVLQKLRWYRETGERSDRQWNDVQGILKVQGKSLDFDYMRYWASELGLSDLLTRSIEDAG